MAVSNAIAQSYPGHLEHLQQHYLDATKLAGKQGVLIASGTLKYAFLDDHTYPFKVNPHFKAWLPVIDVPDSYVLVRPGEKPVLLFHQPEDYWHKTPETPDAFWTRFWDIHPITSSQDAHNLISDPASLMFIGEEVALAGKLGIDAVNDAAVLNHVHFQRAYKTDYEIACLAEASRIGALGHSAAKNAFETGGSEFEIQQAYLEATRQREQHTPYSNIVALNEHCAVLHYQFYDLERPDHSRSMLIDAGAQHNGYASDITRTYASEPGIFADLVVALDEEQLGVIAEITPGMNYANLHIAMHRRLAGLLKRFGILDLAVDTILEENLSFTFLPHGLGHFIGLQTHDVGGFQQDAAGRTEAAPDKYPALRLTRPIEERQVFTIEPGLYFIPMLLRELKASSHSKQVNWSLIDQLLPAGGIRIEDNIVVLEGKPVNLTREAFLKI